ncbi:TIGR01212 family radical SAM protein [Haploplasma axanthum]|nr:TIGR01212 family radical SAM protein [Haploplasma axanthum]
MKFTINERYNNLSSYYKNKYGKKVFKVPINAGFTCPNLDGKVAKGGCKFCSAFGSGEFGGNKKDSFQKQFDEVKERMHQKWPDAFYTVYFQSYTNTYAPLPKLKELYEEAISLDSNIVQISISTRPDEISQEIVDYLYELDQRIDVQIELGLQTIHEKTANDMNRAHDLQSFIDAVALLRSRNIETVVHIMDGLPGETYDMMIETIKFLNTQDIQGIKIHMLNILLNSKLGREYLKNPFPVLTRDEYLKVVVDQIAWLRDDIVIHRLTGDGDPKYLIEPKWIMKKFTVLNDINKRLKQLDLYQGVYYNNAKKHR